MKVTCANCWQDFDANDWAAPRFGSTCFGCAAVLVTPERRQAGFMEAMRKVDTPTLKRWAASSVMTAARRDGAAQVLRDREIA